MCSLSWINVIFSGLCGLKLIKDSLQIPIHSSCLSTTTNRDRIQYLDWAEDFLLNIQQEGRPLEQYVEEFLSVFHLVNWSGHMINACLWMGLDDDNLFWFLSPDDWYRPVADFIHFLLDLNCSYFFDVKNDTYRSNSATLSVPPGFIRAPPRSVPVLIAKRCPWLTQARRPPQCQAHRLPHMCPWEYLGTQSSLPCLLQPQSLLLKAIMSLLYLRWSPPGFLHLQNLPSLRWSQPAPSSRAPSSSRSS